MNLARRSSRRDSTAFSLIETLVATSIIATALMSSLGMMAMGLGQSRESIERARAAMLAQKVFEDFHAGSPLSLPAAWDQRHTKKLLPLKEPAFGGLALVYDEHFTLLDSAPDADAFADGVNDPSAAFIVRIKGAASPTHELAAPTKPLHPLFDLGALKSGHQPLGGEPYPFDPLPATALTATNVQNPVVNLSAVSLSVEAPAQVSAAARKSYRYDFLRQF